MVNDAMTWAQAAWRLAHGAWQLLGYPEGLALAIVALVFGIFWRQWLGLFIVGPIHALVIEAGILWQLRLHGMGNYIATGPVKVVDGDTLEINGRRVRIWGIDAPELAQPWINRFGNPVENYGRRVADELRLYLQGRQVKVQPIDFDQYGRLVAKVIAGRTDIGRWLVSKGLAMVDPRGQQPYLHDQQLAQAKRLGFWDGQIEPPWEYRANSLNAG